ncbi:MAG TPA: CBS domain-containing protein [Acidobacteriota bacterium]|nr:CBS domain-containing protein [Acidobacteriota bacterium]
MKTVRDILTAKGEDVCSISSGATVLDALKIMSEKEIGALVVKGAAGEIAGIISERDYARKVILVGKSSSSTLVEGIMTPADRMIIARPENTTEDCMDLFTGNNIRHLPVLDGSKLMGMISSRDVIKILIAEKKDRIENLYDRLDEIRG